MSNSRAFLLILAVIVVASSLMGCVSRKDYDRLEQIKDNQARAIRNLKDYNTKLQLDYDRLRGEAALSDDERAKLLEAQRVLREEIAKLRRLLEENRGKGMPAPMGVTIEEWGVRVESAVLFDSGQHTLKEAGKSAIKQVASGLTRFQILVEGHTDSDPVTRSKERYPLGNLQLAGMRALAVADFLVKECGLEARNVRYAGVGEFAPIASNETKEGKAKNRRVDIRVRELAETEEEKPEEEKPE